METETSMLLLEGLAAKILDAILMALMPLPAKRAYVMCSGIFSIFQYVLPTNFNRSLLMNHPS